MRLLFRLHPQTRSSAEGRLYELLKVDLVTKRQPVVSIAEMVETTVRFCGSFKITSFPSLTSGQKRNQARLSYSPSKMGKGGLWLLMMFIPPLQENRGNVTFLLADVLCFSDQLGLIQTSPGPAGGATTADSSPGGRSLQLPSNKGVKTLP